MNIDDHRELEIECNSGSLTISAWAKDRAGNDPFVSFQTDIDSGHVSFNLEQAKKLSVELVALVRDLESVGH